MNFGAAFAATKPDPAGQAHTITVDHIEITVYYTFSNNPPPAPESVVASGYGNRHNVNADLHLDRGG